MTLGDVVEQAVAAYGGNQAELARAIRRTASVVGHWRMGRYKPDFESCLALAKITGQSPIEVLQLAGFDPERLLEAVYQLRSGSKPDPEPDDPTDRKIRRRLRQFEEVVGRYPRPVQLAVIEANIRLTEAFGEASFEPAVSSAPPPAVSRPIEQLNDASHASGPDITICYEPARDTLARAA